MGYKVVLTAGEGLIADYGVSGFASVAPYKYLSEGFVGKLVKRYLFKLKSDGMGRMKHASAGLARIEAALVKAGFSRDEVAIVDPRKLEKAVGPETRVVGLSVLDPLDLNYGVQLAKAFMTLIGQEYPGRSYLSETFHRVIWKVKELKPRYHYKVIVGGPGAWQLVDMHVQDYYGVDCVVEGEGERIVGELFWDAVRGHEIPRHVLGKPVPPEEIPEYITPVRGGIVEISRGCGRGCRFCNPGMSWYRSFPMERILKEVRFEVEHGIRAITLQSEDYFRYGSKDLSPSAKAVELAEAVASVDGLEAARPNFGTASTVVQDPKIVEKVADALGVSKDGGVIQMGIETADPRLIKVIMPGKPKPYSAEEWPRIVKEAIEIFNHNGWVVCGTMILGTPWENDKVLPRNLKLVRDLRDYDAMVWPLPFTPSGRSRGMEWGTAKMLRNPNSQEANGGVPPSNHGGY